MFYSTKKKYFTLDINEDYENYLNEIKRVKNPAAKPVNYFQHSNLNMSSRKETGITPKEISERQPLPAEVWLNCILPYIGLEVSSLSCLALVSKQHFKFITDILNLNVDMQPTQISCGDDFTLFLIDSSELYITGNDDKNDFGLGKIIYAPIKIQTTHIGPISELQTGSCSTLVKGDDLWWVCGDYGPYPRENPSGGFSICSPHPLNVSFSPTKYYLGPNGLFALQGDKLFSKGNNDYGQLGLYGRGGNIVNTFARVLISGHSEIQDIFCQRNGTFILNRENELYASGSNIDYQLNFKLKLESIDYFKQVKIPRDIGNIKLISGNKTSSYFLTDAGLYVCGSSIYGALGYGVDDIKIHCLLQIDTTGWGELFEVSCSDSHVVVRAGNGLYGCGLSKHGQLGINADQFSTNFFTKLPTTTLGEIQSVKCGKNRTIVATMNHVYAAGSGEKGQLGLGRTAVVKEFTEILFDNRIKQKLDVKRLYTSLFRSKKIIDAVSDIDKGGLRALPRNNNH